MTDHLSGPASLAKALGDRTEEVRKLKAEQDISELAKAKAMDGLLGAIQHWIESGTGPMMMKFTVPALGVQVTFRGKRITIEAVKGDL